MERFLPWFARNLSIQKGWGSPNAKVKLASFCTQSREPREKKIKIDIQIRDNKLYKLNIAIISRPPRYYIILLYVSDTNK